MCSDVSLDSFNSLSQGGSEVKEMASSCLVLEVVEFPEVEVVRQKGVRVYFQTRLGSGQASAGGSMGAAD